MFTAIQVSIAQHLLRLMKKGVELVLNLTEGNFKCIY